jgi:hypothetical protein
MKYLLTLCITLALAAIAAAQTYQTRGKQAPVRPEGAQKPAPLTQTREVQGAVPRGVRGGNPLQMLNPLAPAKYGTSGQSVLLDPYTWKWNGIKLFEIVW